MEAHECARKNVILENVACQDFFMFLSVLLMSRSVFDPFFTSQHSAMSDFVRNKCVTPALPCASIHNPLTQRALAQELKDRLIMVLIALDVTHF